MGYDPIKLKSLSTDEIIKNNEAAEKQNQIIKQWTPKVRTALRTNAARFTNGKTQSFVTRHGGTQREGKLANSIKDLVRERSGEIYSITFKFERHGVFVHKGVGRGYRVSGGSVVRKLSVGASKSLMKSKLTLNQKINLRSTVSRKPSEWFNPVLEIHIPELADHLATVRADITIKSTAARII